MPHPSIPEIRSFLQHGDLSLAIRRLLDTARDTGDTLQMRQAIRISREYHETKKNNQPVDRIISEAEVFLEQLEQLQPKILPPTLLVSAEEAAKTYSTGHFTLNPVSLQISSGDIWGIVGENGNGKTTLLRCLAGQLAIDKGKIEYPLIKQASYYNIKSRVAFIPQRIPRWYGQLKDNLHFSSSIAGIKGEENELMVEFMMERLQLGSYAHLTWDQISSGYRTRFEIARVLLQKPTLLILDEPLANLDINAQQTILTDLRFMTKSVQHPMGIILSSQQLHEVEKIADKLIFIKQGQCFMQAQEKKEQPPVFVAELETTASRDLILHLFPADGTMVNYNGGFYTISSSVCNTQEILQKLISNQVPVSYFRDITYSTKRFFN